MTERTLVLIKPDGVKRHLIGEILSRIEGKGLSIAALELKDVGDDLARRHYAEHEDKPFFPSLLEFITSGPVVAAIVEGPRAVAAFRQIAGGTDPVEKAAPGTIRGDLALITQDNLVHGAVGFIGVIFAAVWLLIAYLRAEVLRRQKRGLLPGQQSPSD